MKPTDVTIERADGTTLNCELAHLGTDADGMDQWEIANVTYQPGDQIRVGIFPGKTALSFATADKVHRVEWDAE